MSMTTVLRDPGTRSRARARVADLGQPALSPATASAMASMFRVLGDPTRVRLIGALASGERTVGALAQAVGMTESAVSHQLRVLKDARMVKGRPAGRQVYYALDDLHVLTLFRQALTHAREAPGGEAPR
jgi:DNA-binding transcriptional ArsR family regulator